MTDETKPTVKPKRERSPSFPMIPIGTALEKLRLFEETFSRHPAPYLKAAMAWGIKEGSSQANSYLAALKAFELVEYTGSGQQRTVSISESGRTYLRAQQDHIKTDIIKSASLKPRAIAKFWPEWGADRPIDAICLDALVLEHGFNDNAAPTFLRVYDETIAYANLGESGKIVPTDESVEGPIDIKVGDLIQWTNNGVDQFQAPAKILGMSEDGLWVFTDQGASGVPVKEVKVMQAAPATNTPPPIPAHLLSPVITPPPVETLPEGSVILSSGKVKDVSFEVRVTGEVNQTVIDRIVKYLELAKDDYDE